MFVIKNTKTKTYYKSESAIGPVFGATLATAARFKTSTEAAHQMTTHSFGYAFCEIVPLPRLPSSVKPPKKVTKRKASKKPS